MKTILCLTASQHSLRVLMMQLTSQQGLRAWALGFPTSCTRKGCLASLRATAACVPPLHLCCRFLGAWLQWLDATCAHTCADLHVPTASNEGTPLACFEQPTRKAPRKFAPLSSATRTQCIRRCSSAHSRPRCLYRTAAFMRRQHHTHHSSSPCCTALGAVHLGRWPQGPRSG